MATYIEGTNVPVSAIAGNKKGGASYWAERLRNAENPNDVLFEMAYWTPPAGAGPDWQGQGQGNPNVGAVQRDAWSVNDSKTTKTWAEDHINSSNDVYIQDDGDVVSMDPKTGKVLVNQRDSDGNLGNAPVGAVISGDQSKLDSDILTWIKGNTTDNSGNNTTTTSKAATSLLNYRPWTQRYWNQNIPEKSQGLLEMTRNLQPEYSLAYQPGEFRDPNTWAKWADDHKGHIPEGAWRRATVKPSGYLDGNVPRQNLWDRTTGGAYQHINAPDWQTAGQAVNPWEFTAPAMGTNVAWQPWNAKSMNLESANVADWGKFLKSIDTSPAVDTSGLLAKKTGTITIDN
jgi:hypothetical protein